MIGTEFVPDEDRGEFDVWSDLPPGTSFDQSVAHVAQIEQTLGKIPKPSRSSAPSASRARSARPTSRSR